ncbi:MAG: hypothetical protein ACE5FD_12360, partial [Anaerolineae bacterium]
MFYQITKIALLENYDFSEKEAHRIVNVFQAQKFKKDGSLTPYHAYQLEYMSREELGNLKQEYTSKNREKMFGFLSSKADDFGI